ncbi:MAG: 3-hydroxyacyl-CoA dehydrogenase family protein, partial [Planctomycetaceae bacterium]|nr:3-hydroxyacyl-CoA dehydrogenase family protein [Planctomycetaceae bacterium]
FALGGYQVRGYDEHPQARDTLHERVRHGLEAFVAGGQLAAEAVEDVLGRIQVADSEQQAVARAQFVVEAIAENLAAKQAYFTRIEQFVADATIIASNSSTFTVSAAGTGMRLPERAVVTHWFNPPHLVPTVEVVPGPDTYRKVTETTVALHRKIGKLAVTVNREVPGFLVNRVQIAMIREVWDLYEQGVASPADIDAAIRGSLGFRLALYGPLEICDFGGVNIWSTVYQGLAPELRSDATLPDAVRKLVEAGRHGTSSGAGFFDYESTSPGAAEAGRQAAIARATAERDAAMLKLAALLHDQPGPAEKQQP